MPNISARGNNMPESPIRKLVPYAESAKAKGTHVYHLNIGQPDIETPSVALESMKGLDRKVIEYSHSAGFQSYRDGLAKYYASKDIQVSSDEILVTTAGSEAILFGLMACLNPNDEIIINGGITNTDEIKDHLKKTNGVMIGRAAYHTPYLLADIEREIFKNKKVPSRQEVIENLIPYVKDELKKGTRLNQIMRHTLGLFHGQSGASYWKRYLSKNMCVRDADIQKIDHIMDKIKYNNFEQRVG